MDSIKKFFRSLNNTSTKTLKAYGDIPISGIQMQRFPIASAYEKIGNLVSNGSISDFKKQNGHDNLFHLRMVLNINNHLVVVQKNESIMIELNYKQHADIEVKNVQVSKEITLNEMMKNTLEAIGPDKFYLYDVFESNCQMFCSDLLLYNGLLTDDVQKFIMQDLGTLAKKIPSFARKLANFGTSTLQVVKRALGGNNEKKEVKFMITINGKKMTTTRKIVKRLAKKIDIIGNVMKVGYHPSSPLVFIDGELSLILNAQDDFWTFEMLIYPFKVQWKQAEDTIDKALKKGPVIISNFKIVPLLPK